MRNILRDCKRFGVEFDDKIQELAELHDLIEQIRKQQSRRNEDGEHTLIEEKAIVELEKKARILVHAIEYGPEEDFVALKPKAAKGYPARRRVA